MTKNHRYILEPYKGIKTRHTCPGCDKKRSFTLYIDTETNEPINDKVGKCDHASSCGYHYTPKQYFQDNDIHQNKTIPLKRYIAPEPKKVSFIPADTLRSSLNSHEPNNLIKFLINLFGVEITNSLISKYFISTSKHRFKSYNYQSEPGATVFWQIDTQGRVRGGKIMLYNPTTGKRIKEPFDHFTWAHSVLKINDFGLSQCLFGEHLLSDKLKPVALVESEKTAIIASIYLPQFIWLATGGKSELKEEKCSVLKGRTVVLFPDLKCYDMWSVKAKELSHIARFTVSDLLERKATEAERLGGLDIADYLVRFNYKEFTEPRIEPATTHTQPQTIAKYFYNGSVIIGSDEQCRANYYGLPEIITN